MITLTSLSKIYRTNEIETVALENVNLTVDRGEFLSIMGPSGCGKSTLLNIMGLLDAPTTGTIEINGTHTEGMKDKELAAFRNKTLGFVFQSFHLSTHSTYWIMWSFRYSTVVSVRPSVESWRRRFSRRWV